MWNEDDFLDSLKQLQGYWYLASPYTLYPAGLEAACKHVSDVAAWLILHGVTLFSPIAHSHTISGERKELAADHKTWMRVDRPFMEASVGCIVVCMPTWQDSRGVTKELDFFREHNKPIFSMPWPIAS